MESSRDVVAWMSLGALCAASACAGAPPPRSQDNPLLSRVRPSFYGETLTNTSFASDQARGHKMILKFFSSTCARCSNTVSAVERIRVDDSSIVVVGVAEEQSAADVREFVTQRGVHFPVLLDGNGSIARDYHVTEVPTTFVIAPNGSVSWVGGSEQTEEGIRAAIAAATD
jgi:cytochrome c biogenesis protein CcmG/thiol:disulfide interchange protein DsbE